MTAKAARTFALRACLGIGLFATLVFCAHGMGLRINESPSLPIGIWRVSPARPRLAKRRYRQLLPSRYIGFSRGAGARLCRQRTVRRRLRAASQTRRRDRGGPPSQTGEGIRINGRLIVNSKSLGRDGSGRTLPSTGTDDVIVAKGEVWVISSYNPLSFDSRYFGPIPISRIEGLARPLFVVNPLHHP